MASTPSTSATPPQPPPKMPQRPPCRPRPRRAHTLLFWTIFVLFVTAICYLGLLAFTGNTGTVMSRAVFDSHRIAECLVVLCAVAAIAAGIATRHQHH